MSCWHGVFRTNFINMIVPKKAVRPRLLKVSKPGAMGHAYTLLEGSETKRAERLAQVSQGKFHQRDCLGNWWFWHVGRWDTHSFRVGAWAGEYNVLPTCKRRGLLCAVLLLGSLAHLVCCLDSMLLQLKTNELPTVFPVTATGILVSYWQHKNPDVVATDGIACVL